MTDASTESERYAVSEQQSVVNREAKAINERVDKVLRTYQQRIYLLDDQQAALRRAQRSFEMSWSQGKTSEELYGLAKKAGEEAQRVLLAVS